MNGSNSNSSLQNQSPQQAAAAQQQQSTAPYQQAPSPQQTNMLGQQPNAQATTAADFLDQQVRSRGQQTSMSGDMNTLGLAGAVSGQQQPHQQPPQHSQHQHQHQHQHQQVHQISHSQTTTQQPQQQQQGLQQPSPQQQHHQLMAHNQQQQQQQQPDQQHFAAMGEPDGGVGGVNVGPQTGARVSRQRQRLPTYNANPHSGSIEDQVSGRHNVGMPVASGAISLGGTDDPNMAAITAASMASLHQNQGVPAPQTHPLAVASAQNQHALAAMSALAPHQQPQPPHHMANPHAQHNPNPAGTHHLPRMMSQPQPQQPQNAQAALHAQVPNPMGVTDYVPSAEPSHICPVCHDAFGDEQSLARHAARSHSQNNSQRSDPLHCTQCSATLANPQNLRRHMAVCHSGDRTGPLRRGSTGGMNKSANPNRKPKTAKVFVCSLCPTGTTFRWKGNLKRHHQLIHLQAKPYKCEICNEAFGTKSNREVHMIVHLSDKRDLGAARSANVQNAPGNPMGAPGVGLPGAGIAGAPGMTALPNVGASMQGAPHNPQQAHQAMPAGVGGMGIPHAMTGIAGIPNMGAIPNQAAPPHAGHQLTEHDPHSVKYDR